VRFADGLCSIETFLSEDVFRWCKNYAAQNWAKQSFFRLLNRMLFRAAKPEERVKVFEKFYRRPDGLVARFYAGRLNPLDQVRMLLGAPPVPITQALKSMFQFGK
jgi:lycopene beta-cyclase